MEDGRIAVLRAELADQIAAGEVVERPASVIKELVENAIDAGARRVEVELEAAGLERIVVRDDGRGIHADDLELAITRHATSKLRRAEELLDVATLGFRGEALASIAAVAQVVIESRQAGTEAGMRMRSRPGLAPEFEPVGMAVGTRVEVLRLFANVPARRKFMRAEATEVGHCSEALLRLSLSHPGVHLRLRHGGRELFDLAAGPLPARIEQVLRRRTGAPIRRIAGEEDGIAVEAFLAADAVRSRGGLYVIVRRRVVREKALAQIVGAALGNALPEGTHAIGCLLVEPPAKTVDVNVHPQKAEVRFSDPQRVYAAVRRVLASAAIDDAPAEDDGAQRFSTAVANVLDGWAPKATIDDAAPYRLRTRAAESDYAAYRSGVREEVARLPRAGGGHESGSASGSGSGSGSASESASESESGSASASESASGSASESASASESDAASASVSASASEFLLLTVLPGPVALVRLADDLLAIDLRVLRAHLVYRRLVDDLGGDGVAAQFLLQPVVVERSRADVQLCADRAGDLAAIGLHVEAFGDDALLVRGVPARLRDVVDELDAAKLLAAVIPWLRVGTPDRDEGLRAVAAAPGSDPAPRLARRWLRELLAARVDLATVPGIRRFTAADLRSRS